MITLASPLMKISSLNLVEGKICDINKDFLVLHKRRNRYPISVEVFRFNFPRGRKFPFSIFISSISIAPISITWSLITTEISYNHQKWLILLKPFWAFNDTPGGRERGRWERVKGKDKTWTNLWGDRERERWEKDDSLITTGVVWISSENS